MKLKNKIKLTFIFAILIASIVTISYARYVLNKSIDVEVHAPPSNAGTLDFAIKNNENTYNVSTNDDKTTISSKVTLTNIYNIQINSYYAWTTSNDAPTDENYMEFDFNNDEKEITKENAEIGTYYLWVKIKYVSEIGEQKQIVKTSKMISVILGDIKITIDNDSEFLTGDVTATISYVGEYKYNTKAGYGKTEEEAIASATFENADKITIVKEEIDTVYYIYASAENSSGNTITSIFKIDKIDNIKPTINEVTPSFARVKIDLSDNKSGIKEYTVTTTNKEPETYTNILDIATTNLETYINNLNTNTTYYLWVKDVVGNVSSQEFKTLNLTYETTPDLAVWTSTKTIINFCDLGDATLAYNLGGTTSYSYNKITGIEIYENAIVSYILQDGSNQITGNINVNNIDKVAPTVNVVSDYDKVTITGKDTGSGIVGYFITDTEVEDITKVSFTSVSNTNSLNCDVTKDYLGNNLLYNKQYYVYIKDKVGNISRGEVISKIDVTEPKLEITNLSSDTKSITVVISSEDTESGLTGNYKYYIGTQEGVYSETPVETINTKYTFSNLEHNKTYYIKVETQDVAGRVNTTEASIKTLELVVDNDNSEITFTNGFWSSNIQTVTLKTTTNYKMKYQIVKANGTLELANSYWSDAVESGTKVVGLEHGDILYVKLYDGTNTSTNWATYNVINAMKVNYPTLTETQVRQMTIANFNILTYSVNTSEIQVATSTYNSNTLTYNYYMKNVKTDEYDLIMTSSTYNEKVTISQPREYQIYSTICVQLANNTQGTLTRSKNKTITIANESIDSGTIADENKTYIDSEYFTATVPKGFKVSNDSSENTVLGGLVLEDENSNEFVWIPVNNAIYNETATSLSTSKYYTPMVRTQNGNTDYFEKIFYSFSGTTATGNVTSTGYRLGGSSNIEPALITGSSSDKYTWNVTNPVGTLYDVVDLNYKDILGFESINDFGSYLNSEYTKMVKSVDRNGGFLVGRYETTINATGKVGSKAGENILNNQTWYDLYKAQNNKLNENNTYYDSTVLKSSMITGSQYDAMISFALQGNDKSKVTSTSLLYGNKTGNIATAGSYENDKISNIYDLISNVYEETVESNSYSYRLARGGAYFSNVTGKSVIAKTNVYPTDSAEAYGSRMALYLLDSSDKTAPTFDVKTTSGVNNIKVDIINIEDDSDIGKYYYSISLSSDGTTWEDEIITTSNTYTFENLHQSRLYYIRVKVSDEVGNESGYIIKSVNTNSMNISSNDLYIRSFYGTNPNCVAILAMGSVYEESGFNIKYKVLESAADLEEKTNFDSSSWNIGNVVQNLSDTNVILAKLADSNGNEQEDYVVFYLDGYSEEFSSEYSTTSRYEDTNKDIAYIPAGFSVGVSSSINTIKNGLVIQDSSGNQFVWVPVPNAIKNSSTSITENYTPMAMYQTGKNSKYYEGIYYAISNTGVFSYNLSYKMGTYNYREPSLVTGNTAGSAILTWDIENTIIKTANRDTTKFYYKTRAGYNSAEEFGKYMNEEYYNMINSVEKYGGFYIARYETSVNGTKVQSQQNKTPYRNASWYNMNYYQDSNRYSTNPYYNSKSVVSSMMWNSQYSAMLNWIYRNDNSNLLTDTTIGYHTAIANTGKTTTDIINNIFDLSGNVSEFTMGAYSNYAKILRGGNYNSNSSSISCIVYDAGGTSAYYGTRMALYVIDETDNVNPSLTKRENGIDKDGNIIYIEPYTTSNSITVKVTAYDPDNTNETEDNQEQKISKVGSGIKKYVYSISSTTDESGNYINYKDYTNYGNTFTYEVLNEGTTYDMKVTVYDHTGKTAQIDLGTATTTITKIDTSEIYEDAVYGTEGNGTIYLDFKDSFNEIKNYYIEYQIGKQGANYNENGTWLKTTLVNPQTGVQVDGLSVGDIVYARVTDGVNILERTEKVTDEDGNETIVNLGTSIYSFNVSELETYSEIYETKTEYSNSNGDKATIPAGFAVNNLYNEIKNGLVIKRMKDNKGNSITNGDEFVWVPVKDAIYDTSRSKELASSSSSTNTYKPMARLQGDYATTDSSYYEGILYNFAMGYKTGSYVRSTGNLVGTSTGYREISLITGSNSQLGWKYINSGTLYDASENYYKNILGFNSVNEFGEYMNKEYTDMVKSVEKYGGFWIARYETSLPSKGIISSTKGQTPMASTNWYNMYYYQESGINSNNPYSGDSDVVSTMIFGSQWDAMLNWVLTGEEANKVHTVIGNHENSRAVTGKYGSDYINNMFDISSNVLEWTQEANASTYRVYRGGYYSMYSNYTASFRFYSTSTYTNYSIGSRFTLYVK